MITVPSDYIFEIPSEVATCPYCETKLRYQCDTWTQQDDGTWTAEHIYGTCETEPEIESKKWRGWLRRHSCMPYVYQLPIDMRALKWINERYRFDMGG